ncbi:hypothetical protein PS710_02871 [Pseudomonas fluorescens]|uniref:Uncharacterized protein n=1 Tax=Pseudomonas fluorescens TaxID=294 RepID=A0A5E7CFH6_PSEFL|nr:hypothetical protein PS710_02871 [Pseudomonas fluorescens]
MKNPRPLIRFKFTFNQASGHLNADAQHRLGDFHVLALQERLGILREIQSNQRTLVLGPAQLDTAVW